MHWLRAAGERSRDVTGWRVGVLAVLAIAVLARIVFGRIPLDATDVTFTLIWGRELADGQLPDYEAFGAITPHPLFTLLGGLASLFGADGAFAAMRVLAYLSFGALVWGVFLLGRAAFSTLAGAVAAVAIATNPVLLGTPLSGTVDTPAIALVVFAALLVVREPRRATPVFGLLFVAGLLRPEIWIFAAIYWFYLYRGSGWPERARFAALACAAPVAWLAFDAIVTGEPLFSLTHTQDVASAGGRETGGGGVPRAYVDGLREVLRPPELVGGFVGVALVLWLRRRGVSLVPLVLLAGSSLAFAMLGIAELSLRERYLLIPAVVLVLTFGFALVGWQRLTEATTERRAWLAGACVLLAATLAFAPSQLAELRDLDERVEDQVAVREDLRDLVRDEGVGLAARCPSVHATGTKLVPLVGYHLDRSTNTIASTDDRPPRDGLVVVPTTADAGSGFIEADDLPALRTHLRHGFERAAGNRSWSLYVSGCRSH